MTPLLASAIRVVGIWLALSLASSTLRAEPLDRQVAEWVILMGGSVRLEGRAERIREVTKLPADDFHLELADLVGTNILPPDLQWLTGLTRSEDPESPRAHVESRRRVDASITAATSATSRASVRSRN